MSVITKIFFCLQFVILLNAELITTNSELNLCERQVEYIDENYEYSAKWAREMKNSWGRFPSGVFSGNRFDFGHFDQCIEFHHSSDAVGEINGQFCTIFFSYDLEATNIRARFTPHPFSSEVSLGVGICLPHTCTTQDVKNVANTTLMNSMNISISESYRPDLFCSSKRDNFELNGLQITAIVIFSLFALLVLLSTIYEVSNFKLQSKSNPFLTSFSIYSNSKIIMTMKSFSDKEMSFLHGIRSLAIIWVVICHTYTLLWMVPGINSDFYTIWIQNLSSMFILSGYQGVDTFFMLSAMLLTIGVFHELDKTNRINLLILYAKRYFRIAIPLAALIMFTVTFFYYLANGPLWHLITTTTSINLCQQYWWTTLLFVSNYVNPGKLCFGHSWYLIVDMQLYFLSPIILYPLWRFRKYGKIMIPLIFLIGSVAIIYIFVMYVIFRFRVSLLSELSRVKEVLLYYMTHARLDSWMMGILTGYILHRIEGKAIKLPQSIVIIGWTLSACTILTIIFAQYPLHQVDFENNSIFADATYDAFRSTFWCLAVMWIIIACRLNYGGIVKRFLSLSIWFPISKLSFCIYLIHLPVQVIYLASIRSPHYFTDFRAIHKFFGDFGITFFIAFVWAMMFEYPVIRITKVLIEIRKVKRDKLNNV